MTIKNNHLLNVLKVMYINKIFEEYTRNIDLIKQKEKLDALKKDNKQKEDLKNTNKKKQQDISLSKCFEEILLENNKNFLTRFYFQLISHLRYNDDFRKRNNKVCDILYKSGRDIRSVLSKEDEEDFFGKKCDTRLELLSFTLDMLSYLNVYKKDELVNSFFEMQLDDLRKAYFLFDNILNRLKNKSTKNIIKDIDCIGFLKSDFSCDINIFIQLFNHYVLLFCSTVSKCDENDDYDDYDDYDGYDRLVKSTIESENNFIIDTVYSVVFFIRNALKKVLHDKEKM